MLQNVGCRMELLSLIFWGVFRVVASRITGSDQVLATSIVDSTGTGSSWCDESVPWAHAHALPG